MMKCYFDVLLLQRDPISGDAVDVNEYRCSVDAESYADAWRKATESALAALELQVGGNWVIDRIEEG